MLRDEKMRQCNLQSLPFYNICLRKQHLKISLIFQTGTYLILCSANVGVYECCYGLQIFIVEGWAQFPNMSTMLCLFYQRKLLQHVCNVFVEVEERPLPQVFLGAEISC